MSFEAKTLVTQLQEAKAATEGFTAKIAEMEASHAAKVAELDGKIAAMQSSIDEAAKAVELQKIAAEEAVKAFEGEKVEHAKTKEELVKAQSALSNPAFADAAIKGTAGAGSEGGVVADAVEPEMTREQAVTEYAKLSDARAKQAFRRKNWKALGIKEEK